jgi:hypothetical protein
MYVYGEQGERVTVKAVRWDRTPATVDFRNDFAFGTLIVENLTKVVAEYHYTIGDVTGGDSPSERAIEGSWMRPRRINVDEILGGTPFTAYLVTGPNLTHAGTYKISATAGGDLLVELTFFEGMTANTSTKLIVGNANLMQPFYDVIADTDPSNFNTGDGLYMGSAGSSILIPHADIATWATGDMKSQLFFLHTAIDPQVVSIDVSADHWDVGFGYRVVNSSNVVIAEFTLKHGERYTITELPAGAYTVIETTGFATDDIVNVVAGKETLISIENIRYIYIYDN